MSDNSHRSEPLGTEGSRSDAEAAEPRRETITDRMRKLKEEMGVVDLPVMTVPRSHRQPSTVPTFRRQNQQN